MQRYKLTLQYYGPDFSGWQKQNNVHSVDNELTLAAKKFFNTNELKVYGSGRTDVGVHAIKQVAHIDVNMNIDMTNLTTKQICLGINFYISRKMQVIDTEAVSEAFHARYSAISRTYKYIILNNDFPDIMKFYNSWCVRSEIDMDLLQTASEIFIGSHDFKNFSKHTDQNTTRTINEIKITKNEKYICIYITAKAFIRNQVRYIVSAMIDVATNKRDIHYMNKLLNLKSNVKIKKAPAYGLYLYNVEY